MSEESKPVDANSTTDASKSAGATANAGRQRRKRTEYRSDGEAAKKGLRYIVLPLIGVTVVAVGGWLLARPAAHKFREHRGHTFAVQAGKEFAEGKTAESVKSLRLALAMAPNDPDTLRNAASILGTEEIPDALDFWQKLFQMGLGTTADRVRYAALATRLQRFGLATSELNLILKANPQDMGAKQMLVEVSILGGDFRTAIANARELLANESTLERQFLLGSALIRSSKTARTSEDLKAVEEGAKVLLPLATQVGPWQSPAAAALADNTRLTGEAAAAVLAAFAKKEKKSVADVVTTAVIQVRDQPARALEYMNSMAQELSGAGIEDRLRAASWMASIGGAESASKLIRFEDSKTNIIARMLSLDMASQRGDWNTVKLTLADTNQILPSVVRSSLTAGVAMSEGNNQKADALFRTAMDEAIANVTIDPELQYIALIAERATNLLAAVAAQELRLQIGAAVPDASQNILRLTSTGLPLVRQFTALEARHLAMPEDVATSSQYFFVSALLGRNLEEAKRGLIAMREAYPDRPEPILGLALVAIRSGPTGPTEAANLLEEHPLDFETLPVRLRPALVYVQGQTGRKDLARANARKLALNQCYPEERELVEPWLTR